MSPPSPLCFPLRPRGSGAASRPCKARLHALAPARPPLAPEDAAAHRGRCPGLPVPEECPLRRGSCPPGFSHPFCSTGWDAQYRDKGQGGLPGHAIPSPGAPWVRCPGLPGSRHIPPAHPGISLRRGRGARVGSIPGWPWHGGKAPGPRLTPAALAATGAAETLRRVGAARSHLPLIEFICYNPKQCKAGFSQAPAACLPIKIPSRTANPPLPP